MNIIKYPDAETASRAIEATDPLVILISFDGETVILSRVEDTVERHTLLAQTGKSSLDIDKYFRIVVDNRSADWTFICPPDYKGIADKRRRIELFYKDGFAEISNVLFDLGYYVGINIPYRYSRHFLEMAKGAVGNGLDRSAPTAVN
jgi:hypothetical protein